MGWRNWYWGGVFENWHGLFSIKAEDDLGQNSLGVLQPYNIQRDLLVALGCIDHVVEIWSNGNAVQFNKIQREVHMLFLYFIAICRAICMYASCTMHRNQRNMT